MSELAVGDPVHLTEQDFGDKASAEEAFLSWGQDSGVELAFVSDDLLYFLDGVG